MEVSQSSVDLCKSRSDKIIGIFGYLLWILLRHSAFVDFQKPAQTLVPGRCPYLHSEEAEEAEDLLAALVAASQSWWCAIKVEVIAKDRWCLSLTRCFRYSRGGVRTWIEIVDNKAVVWFSRKLISDCVRTYLVWCEKSHRPTWRTLSYTCCTAFLTSSPISCGALVQQG